MAPGSMILLLVAGSAQAQPCVLCRTEKCPRKEGLADWCGTGRDPLAPSPSRRSARPKPVRSGDEPFKRDTDASLKRLVCPPEMVPVDGRFCLDRTEVTAADYRACREAGACSAAGEDEGCNGARADRARHPINCVEPAQAIAFCRARGARLPTEDEWAWAARGGDAGTRYPWGEAPPVEQPCWDGAGGELSAGARTATCEAGSHPADRSPSGALDLAGNVAEWTVAAGGRAAIRGGSWGSFRAASVGASVSVENPATAGNRYTGFRCARSP